MSLKGTLLVAAPELVDPNFVRTVIFIAEHTPEGAFGLVLNRPGRMRVSDVWQSLSEEPCPLEACTYAGGPVQENAVTFLHGFGDLMPEGESVVPGVYLGSEADLLKRVVNRSAEPSNEAGEVRVFCGYSGWGPGQLDGEMESQSWLTVPADAEHVFSSNPEHLWSHVISSIGGAFKFYSMMPPDPELN